MKQKWFVVFNVYASTSMQVEADTEEEARELAEQNVHVSLCHQCSREVDIGDVGEILEVGRVEE